MVACISLGILLQKEDIVFALPKKRWWKISIKHVLLVSDRIATKSMKQCPKRRRKVWTISTVIYLNILCFNKNEWDLMFFPDHQANLNVWKTCKQIPLSLLLSDLLKWNLVFRKQGTQMNLILISYIWQNQEIKNKMKILIGTLNI